MAAEPIPFDIGVEILRGPAAALEIHARRTKLALASLPNIWDEAHQQDLLDRLEAPTASA